MPGMRCLPLMGLIVLVGACGGDQGEPRDSPGTSSVQLDVAVEVRVEGSGAWGRRVSTRAGDTVRFLITLVNRGGEAAQEVVLIQRLPTSLRAVTGSGVIDRSDRSSSQDPVRAGLLDGGIVVGPLPALEPLRVEFSARVEKAAAGRSLRTVVTAGGLHDVASASVVLVAEPLRG